jgi:hypothetical protein
MAPLRRELENPARSPSTAEPAELVGPVESKDFDATPPGAGAERTPVEAPPPPPVDRLLDGVSVPVDRTDVPEPESPPPEGGGCETPPPPLEELPPLLPLDDDPAPPPPEDDEPPDDPPLVVRGMAWASARAGVANPPATTNDATWRTDLTMASAPGGPRADLRLA